MLHRASNYAAQGQHMSAYGLQLCCTGPGYGCISNYVAQDIEYAAQVQHMAA